jgi:hypothetical protein
LFEVVWTSPFICLCFPLHFLSVVYPLPQSKIQSMYSINRLEILTLTDQQIFQ